MFTFPGLGIVIREMPLIVTPALEPALCCHEEPYRSAPIYHKQRANTRALRPFRLSRGQSTEYTLDEQQALPSPGGRIATTASTRPLWLTLSF